MSGEGLFLNIVLTGAGLVVVGIVAAKFGEWVINGLDELIEQFGIEPRERSEPPALPPVADGADELRRKGGL